MKLHRTFETFETSVTFIYSPVGEVCIHRTFETFETYETFIYNPLGEATYRFVYVLLESSLYVIL